MRVLILFLIAVIVIGALALHFGYWHPRLSMFGVALPANPASACGLTVVTPLPNTTVSYQVAVSGIVDNSRQAVVGCAWTMFEGQAGQAQILDARGNRIAGPVPISVADWTATSTTFSVGLKLFSGSSTASLAEGTRLILKLIPENPSGRPQTIHLDIPVVWHG